MSKQIVDFAEVDSEFALPEEFYNDYTGDSGYVMDNFEQTIDTTVDGLASKFLQQEQ